MQLIVQRLCSIYRVILQSLKLTDGIADRLANRSLHLCGRFRHHTDIVSTKCTAPHYLRQCTRHGMLRDTIAGKGATERPQLPDRHTGIMAGQCKLPVKCFPLLLTVMPGFTQPHDGRNEPPDNPTSDHPFRGQ